MLRVGNTPQRMVRPTEATSSCKVGLVAALDSSRVKAGAIFPLWRGRAKEAQHSSTDSLTTRWGVTRGATSSSRATPSHLDYRLVD